MKVELYQDLLGLNWNLLFSLITVIVLVLILKHFFFEKVRAFMELREQSIKDSLQNAEKVNQLADKRAAEYEAQLLTAQEKGKEIISEARKTAKKQSEAILQKAERDAEEKLEKSRIEIENEKTAAKKALKDEIGELALMAAGKILEEELDAKKHQAVVDDIMKNAEVSPWEK